MKSSPHAKRLRRDLTDAERKLWLGLRNRRFTGFKFRRQHPIGEFIADFACIEYKLIVEADGGQHAESVYDQNRTSWLESKGWRILRFWNNDILENTNGVLEAICEFLQSEPSPAHSFINK